MGAIGRLSDLGIDRFKTGGALLGVVAQRLLRTICPHCKEPAEPNEAFLQALAHQTEIPGNVVFYRGRGCKKCLGTGYSGRAPIYEIMTVSSKMAEAIEKGLPTTKLREIAISEGMVELAGAGMELAVAGRTTVEEVFYKVSG